MGHPLSASLILRDVGVIRALIPGISIQLNHITTPLKEQ